MGENLTDSELLKYAVDNGIINLSTIQQKIEMNERKRYLEMHENRVWQDKNLKWFYTYLPDENGKRKLVKKSTKEALEDAIVRFYKDVAEDPLIINVFNEWIQSKREYGEISIQTINRYTTDFSRFFDGTRISSIKFKYITEEDLEHFIRASIHDKGLTNKSWSNMQTLLNGIFKFAKKKGYTKISISQFLGDLEIPRKAFTRKARDLHNLVFTDEEVERIISYIAEHKVGVIPLGIILTFLTGLRPGELSSLEWTDIQNEHISISKTEIKYKDTDGVYHFDVRDFPKTEAGEREVVLTAQASKIIKKLKSINPFGQYVFMKDGQRVKGQAFTKKLYRICTSLGIPERSINKARKTYATKLINAKVDEAIILDQMGHTEISTTLGFYYGNNKDKGETIKQVARAIEY